MTVISYVYSVFSLAVNDVLSRWSTDIIDEMPYGFFLIQLLNWLLTSHIINIKLIKPFNPIMYKPSLQAINGTYVDKKCPFTGNVHIRGRILSGVVLKMKMMRTIVIRRDYLHYVKKYNRFEKRHKNMSVHCSPAFRYAKLFLQDLLLCTLFPWLTLRAGS